MNLILILETGCIDCASVKAEIDWGKAGDPTFSGRKGERLFVFVSSNAEAVKKLSLLFEADGVAPLLLIEGQEKGDNKNVAISDVDEIISYINKAGFGRR